MNIDQGGATPPDIDEVLGSIGKEESTSTQTTEQSGGSEEASGSQESESQESTQGGEENKPEVVEQMTQEDFTEMASRAKNSMFQDTDPEGTAKAQADKVAADAAAEKAKADKEAADKVAADAAAAAAADKGAATADDATKGKVEEKGAEEDPHAATLEKEVPGGAHAKEQTRKDWEELRTAAKSYKQQADETKARLAAIEAEKVALEEKAKAAPVPEEITKELEELRGRIVEVDVALLPEIREKYDKKIDEASESILAWFESVAGTEGRTYEVLDAEGNPTGKISGLTPEIVASLRMAVTRGGFANYDWSKWIDSCIENRVISGVDARKLELQIADTLKVVQDKNLEVAKRTQTWASEQLERQIAQQAEVVERRKHAMGISNRTSELITENISKHDWAKHPGEVPANATPEQKAAHEAKLKDFGVRNDMFFKLLKTYYTSQGLGFEGADKVPNMTPDELVGLTVDAFSLPGVRQRAEAAEAKIAELEKELGEFRAAGSTAPNSSTRSGSSEASQASSQKIGFDLTPESVLASIGR